MDLEQTLDTFFRDRAPLAAGDTVLVAFSGGADSTALLRAICAYARGREIRIAAAHIDHGLDPGSAARADLAKTSASTLGLDLIVNRQDVANQRRRGESLEMAARRIRYRELHGIAADLGARYIATAHHRDDQTETVLLRLAAGRGLSGLAAVAPRRGAIVRPLLEHSRADLRRLLDQQGSNWLDDPTNRDLTVPRNQLRHRLIPALEAGAPGIAVRLAGLAKAARRANTRLGGLFEQLLTPGREGRAVTVARQDLEALPPALVPHAVGFLLRRAGSRRQPSRKALEHIESLFATGASIGVDLGTGWRLEEAPRARLRLLRTPDATPAFAYNLQAPGEVRLVELSSTLRLSAGSVEPWMFQGARLRAGFCLPPESRQHLSVRNRRPGDRVQPLGSSSRSKLKDILIDRGIPRYERDRLPLLCNSDRILWVPGVTIDHEARIRNGSEVWVAEIITDE